MDENTGCTCSAGIALVIFNLILGGMAVNYILDVWFSKNISWIGDVLIGLVLAEIAIPVAVATWLLRAFGAI